MTPEEFQKYTEERNRWLSEDDQERSLQQQKEQERMNKIQNDLNYISGCYKITVVDRIK